jgi:hypothetical protein
VEGLPTRAREGSKRAHAQQQRRTLTRMAEPGDRTTRRHENTPHQRGPSANGPYWALTSDLRLVEPGVLGLAMRGLCPMRHRCDHEVQPITCLMRSCDRRHAKGISLSELLRRALAVQLAYEHKAQRCRRPTTKACRPDARESGGSANAASPGGSHRGAALGRRRGVPNGRAFHSNCPTSGRPAQSLRDIAPTTSVALSGPVSSRHGGAAGQAGRPGRGSRRLACRALPGRATWRSTR